MLSEPDAQVFAAHRNPRDGARAHGSAEAVMLSAVCQHLHAFLASHCSQEPKVPPGIHQGQPSPSFPHIWAQRKFQMSGCHPW